MFRLLSWLWFLLLLRSDDRAKYLEIERATFRGIRNLFSISNKTVDERIGPMIEALKQAELLSRQGLNRAWMERGLLRSARRANHPLVCPALFAKIFRFSADPNHLYNSRHPVPTRGALRGRHGRRERDAMDAVASCARTACGRMMLKRTVKSCGPDTPTLVSSLRMQVRRRRGQESPVPGESTKETVKTIARGMPGDSGVT